ncbi:MAG: hypothetical protein HFH23_17165 [Ruminococcus sp.]|nr:hypothetical protein [Ruminococcus sp.]
MKNKNMINKEVISLKLSYLDLLSPEPVYIKNVGGIISPKLRDVSVLGYDTYQFYLELLQMLTAVDCDGIQPCQADIRNPLRYLLITSLPLCG